MSGSAGTSWPLWRYQSFRVHQDRGRVHAGVAAVLKSSYFMVVEPDKGFTSLSSPRWQLDNNFSALFPLGHCYFSSFNIYPLYLSYPCPFLLSCVTLCLSPPFHFYFCPPLRSQVVLLDTTTVLGELDWKTYPVNGVSEMIISYYLNERWSCYLNEYNPEQVETGDLNQA